MGEPPLPDPPPLVGEPETTQPSSPNSNSIETNENENVNQKQMTAIEHGQKFLF